MRSKDNYPSFIVYTLFAMLWINIGLAGNTAAQEVGAERVIIDEAALFDELRVDSFSLQALERPRNLPRRFEVKVTLIEDEVTLSLERFSVRAKGFRLLVQDESGEINQVPPPPANTYRGTVLEIEGSEVAASLNDGQLTALIFLPDESAWVIQPASEVTPGVPPTWHVVYDSADIQPDPSLICGTDCMHLPEVPGGGGEGNDGTPWEGQGAPLLAETAVVDIAFDADVEYYQMHHNSSVNLTMLDIERTVNAIGVIYRREVSIDYWIVAILVRTVDDPYNAPTHEGLLCQFQAEWNANQEGIFRDVAHLMTGRNLPNRAGLARTGVICNVVQRNCDVNDNSAYALSEYLSGQSFARRVALTAHELGHNWDACHCNELDCTGGDPDDDCFIMCASIGRCSSSLTKFGFRAKAAITAHRNSRDCLITCEEVAIIPGHADTVHQGIRIACWGGEVAISAGRYPETFRVNKRVSLTAVGGTVTIGE